MNDRRSSLAHAAHLRRHQRGASFVEAMVLVALAIGVVLAAAQLLGARAEATSQTLGGHITSMTETESRSSPMGSGANAAGTYTTQNAACDATHGCEPGSAVVPPAPQPAPVTPSSTAPAAEPARGIGDYALSFGKGVVVDGIWGTVTGVATMVMHPVDTATGLYAAGTAVVTDPVGTFNAAKDGIFQQWNEDPARLLGGGLFQAATMVGPGAIAKLGTVAKVADVAKVGAVASDARAATTLAKVAETSKAAEVTTSATTKAEQASAACEGGACGRPGANCFAAGTPVLTVEGERPIESVEVGDLVIARNPESGVTEVERVVALFVTPDQELVDLAIEAAGAVEHVRVTGRHPFFTQDRGLGMVKDLAIGEHLQTALGEGTVVSLASLPEHATVFNFEVEEDHNYFVGHVGAWVHNVCVEHAPDFDKARKQAFDKAGIKDGEAIFTKEDPKTGTIVEFKGPDGSKVAYDSPHAEPGPGHDLPHVGVQTAGKRTGKGGAQRTNITYDGPQHPFRSPDKGQGVLQHK